MLLHTIPKNDFKNVIIRQLRCLTDEAGFSVFDSQINKRPTMIKRILLSVSKDPNGAPETTVGVDLAKRHGAEITGITAVEPSRIALEVPRGLLFTQSYANAIDDLVKESLAESEGAIAKLGRICGENQIKFQSATGSDNAEEFLSSMWRFQDLCIIPTHPWIPGIEQPGSANGILHLVVLGLRPLIAVPKTIPTAPPSKVLVALSGSLESAKAMKQFTQLRLYPGVPVHLVTIGNPKSGEQPQELLGLATTYLKSHDHPVTTARLDPTNDRVQALFDEADRAGAEMFVIGSSYKKLLSMERYGKHAVEILQRSKFPVFISH